MSVPTTAQVLKWESHGNPTDVLSLQESPLKACGPTEVLVKLLAAPVNPSDIFTVLGVYPLQPPDAVGGHEGVGEIVATGSDVKRLKVGDHVVPVGSGSGTWRTYGVYGEAMWHAVDKTLSLHDKATMLINPGTAMLMLEEFVDLKAGDCVIQNGANSEVGKYVISLAKERGIKTINIVRDRPNLAELAASLKALGADIVATPETVEKMTKDAGLEPKLGLNCVGGEVATTMANLLAVSGTLVTYGAMTMEPVALTGPVFIFKNLKLVGFWISKFSGAAQSREAMVKLLDRVAEHIAKGTFKSSGCTELALGDWKKAFANPSGKAMLVMDK